MRVRQSIHKMNVATTECNGIWEALSGLDDLGRLYEGTGTGGGQDLEWKKRRWHWKFRGVSKALEKTRVGKGGSSQVGESLGD